MDVLQFKKMPVMGILRGISESVIEPLVEVVIASGLTTLEITMNTKEAPALIKKMAEVSAGRLNVGAGTVLSLADLRLAYAAGASFIVSPVFIPEVVTYCVEKNIPVFPGAFTPSEIFAAYRAGAAMVKVFPAKCLGPEYIKEIKGPFNDIELLVCGGVNCDNVGEFFEAGGSAVAFGGSIFKEEWLRDGCFELIGKSIVALVEKVTKVINETNVKVLTKEVVKDV